MRKSIGQLDCVECYRRRKVYIVGLHYTVARRCNSRRGSFSILAKLRNIPKLMENSETPTIAEKVKFWEEQDRINQALIPRVIKMHEISVDLGKTLASVMNDFALIEAKAANFTEEKVVQLRHDLTSSFITKQSFQETLTQVEGHIAVYPELTKELSDRVVHLEETFQALQKQKEDEQIRLDKQLKRFTIILLVVLTTALSVGVLSLVVALVRK